jgi:hypothetical protein
MEPNSRPIMELDQIGGRNGKRSVFPRAAELRAVVVTESVPIPIPFASEYEAGFTEHCVACAGTVQETVTVEENPKKGFTPISLMYDAVCPATTVCVVIPRFATVKSAARFKLTAAEFEAV